MNKYKCSCCGGNINRVTMTCEYCGTLYKEEHGNIIRFETFINPVETLASKRILDNYMLMNSNPREYAENEIRSMALEFAECIAPYMDLQYSFDPFTGRPMMDARIKVVKPINKPTNAIMELIGG